MSYANEIGRIGEEMVAKFLRSRGYIIFARNHHEKYGEIDIVAENRDIMLFVEVKTRKADSIMNPADAVDYEKQHKLINTARVFLKKAHYFGAIRFDIAEVTYNVDECGEYHFSLNYIKNAFPADELMPD